MNKFSKEILIFSLTIFSVLLLTACAQKTPSGILIDYRQTGGLVNLDKHLTLQSNGDAVLVQNGKRFEFSVDDNTLQSIRQKFEDSQFSKMDKKYFPDNICCDLVDYTIVYQGYRVETADGAIPDVLWNLIETLNEICKLAH